MTLTQLSSASLRIPRASTDHASQDTFVAALWLVGGIALAVRVLAAVALDGFLHPHVEEYDTLAKNMLAGRGFTYPFHGRTYHSMIAPWPAWLSAFSYWLSGSLAVAIVIQIVAGAGTAVGASVVARRLFGGWEAPLAAGLLVALHPGLVVYTASRAHSLPFDALVFTLAVLQGCRIFERPTAMRAACLGLVVGLGILSRATVLLVLPVVAAWLLIVRPRVPFRTAVLVTLTAGVCAAAVVAPWTIRNSVLHGRFVFLLTTDGDNFWRGNNPNATGTSHFPNGRTVFSSLSEADIQDLYRQPSEVAQNDWFKARAREFIRTQPDAFVRLFFLKLFYFWWYAPTTGLLYPAGWFWISFVYYVGSVILAASGVWRIIRSGGSSVQLLLLIGALLLVVSSFQSLYYVEGRHRWAVEPMLLALSGGGAAALLSRWRPAAARA